MSDHERDDLSSVAGYVDEFRWPAAMVKASLLEDDEAFHELIPDRDLCELDVIQAVSFAWEAIRELAPDPVAYVDGYLHRLNVMEVDG